MEDKDLLNLCLKITGTFEGGTPSFTDLAGNADGMGLSAGILQWNAGQGTLQSLLLNIGSKMGWDKAQSFFHSDIHHLALCKPKDAIQFCLKYYIAEGSKRVDSRAAAAWMAFLGQPESIAAQIELATNTVLHRAKALVQTYTPNYASRTRAVAFFFDLVTQSGGMENKKGKVEVLSGTPDCSAALALAQQKSPKTEGMWELVIKTDPLAALLLYYAHARALLSRPEYIWDGLSRRGTIACRSGVVHSTSIHLTDLLD